MIASDVFGALTAELRRAEANHHDVQTLLPRLVRARELADADDIAAVLHERLTRATARPTGSGRARKAARLIAGLIPEATGTMAPDMHQALTERQNLIEARVDALLDQALKNGEKWIAALGTPLTDTKTATSWRRHARTITAYRDRYAITTPTVLGAPPESAAQKIDVARARAALNRAQTVAASRQHDPEDMRPSAKKRTGRRL